MQIESTQHVDPLQCYQLFP